MLYGKVASSFANNPYVSDFGAPLSQARMAFVLPHARQARSRLTRPVTPIGCLTKQAIVHGQSHPNFRDTEPQAC